MKLDQADPNDATVCAKQGALKCWEWAFVCAARK